MTSSDADIPIIESKNLDDDAANTGKETPGESEVASTRALEKQGIFLVSDKEHPTRTKPRSEFSRDLAEVGGIEIMPTDDKE